MFEPQAVARVLAKEAFEPDLVTAETAPISGTEASSLPPIGIYASSYETSSCREIAEDLAHDFSLTRGRRRRCSTRRRTSKPGAQ